MVNKKVGSLPLSPYTPAGDRGVKVDGGGTDGIGGVALCGGWWGLVKGFLAGGGVASLKTGEPVVGWQD